MPDLDRVIAGLRCRDVLALLADYVDGDLASDDVARVDAHLSTCDHCEKFGGEYGALVSDLRNALVNRPLEPGVEERLAARMGSVWAEGAR